MDDIVRKRNSSWDVPEASRHNYRSQKDHNSTGDGWRHQTLSPTEADNNLIKPKDRSRWSSREQSESKNSVQMNECLYDDRQREWGQRKYNHSPDDLDKSRYLEQRSGRSRSRDRGRTRGRSRSRSRGGDLPDWSWDRDRDRSRSRSRSRSKNRKRARSRTRSRSPLNDHRHDSYGHTDRIASRSSSHVCRDFAAGMCRRGSQCRFLHSDNLFSADGSSTQDDSAERSRNRPEPGNAGRYLNSEGPGGHSREKVHGEDERFQSRSRGTINCKEFMRGKCKWGASCRFSHHVPSGDNNVRKASFDRDNEPQSQETGKTLCRYFLAGTCQRVNCKFSHHVPTSNNHDDRPRDEGEGQSLVVHSAWQDGKTWNAVGQKSKNAGTTRWSKNVVTSTGTADVVPNIRTDDPWVQESDSWVGAQSEKNDLLEDKNVPQPPWNQNNAGGSGSIKSISKNLNDRYEDHTKPSIKMDDQWGQEAKSWVGVQSENNVPVDDRNMFHHPWNKNNDGGTGSIESMARTSNDGYEDHITSQDLGSGSMDEISMAAHGQNVKPGASSQHYDVSAMHADGSIGSDAEDKKFGEVGTLKTFTFDRHDAVKDPGIAINPLVPGDINNGSGVGNMLFNHLVSNDHKDDMFSQHPSDERNFNLNNAGQLLPSLNLPNQHSYQTEVVKAPEMQEFVAPQSFRANSSFSQVAQMAYHDASTTQKLVNERVEPHTQMPNNFTSTGFVPSVQSLVPPVNMMYLHSNLARPPDHYNLLGDGRDPNVSGNNNFRPGHLPYSLEQHDEMILEPFSPPSIVNPELEPFSPPSTVVPEIAETLFAGKAGSQHQHSTEAKQQGATVILEALDIDKNDVGCKEEQDNTNKESASGNDNAEHGTSNKEEKESNKEDKEMRLFKNALVEFVKDVLKPKWKEGRMSREVHKTIVKKVVDKVSSAIQGNHIPKTKDKVEQYLASSKSKISKLVQAYVERHVKAES